MAGKFTEIETGVWAYSSDHGPTSGLIIGEDVAMVVDGQADVALADDFAACVAATTDLPVAYVLISHYHASRWINLDRFVGASLITTRKCRSSILHRAAIEARAAAMREPDLYPEPRLTDIAPPRIALTFKSALTVDLGGRRVECIFFGQGHTGGDAVVWVQDAGVMFTGDLVERGVAPFLGEASFQDWMQTLDKIAPYRPAVLVPGRGRPVSGKEAAQSALAEQRSFVDQMWRIGSAAATGCQSVPHVMDAIDAGAASAWRAMPLWQGRLPFAASRMIEAAHGRNIPQIWTPERVQALRDELGLPLS